MPNHRVAVIVGSSRPRRIASDIAAWVRSVAAAAAEGTVYDIIDLAEINLPFLDEALPAATGVYEHEHTRRWSALIASYDAFVVVAPQYNWSYPAVLKNALDFLYAEWRDKPVAVVSYGSHGGGRATVALQQVFLGLHMRNVAMNPALITDETSLDRSGRLLDAAELFAKNTGDIRTMAAQLARAAAEPRAEPAT